MPEIVDFVNRGAASITPAIVERVLRHLPQWKLEFTQIYEPLFPHLVDQLEFLADAASPQFHPLVKKAKDVAARLGNPVREGVAQTVAPAGSK